MKKNQHPPLLDEVSFIELCLLLIILGILLAVAWFNIKRGILHPKSELNARAFFEELDGDE